ncbi:MAG: type VI secretion system-associated FHA domain protein TagH [Cellvibrionaceae bacterium]
MNLELITINDGNPSAKELRKTFDNDGGTIGRDSSCDFILPCNEKLVSRVHAEINFQNGQFRIRDSSANGVFINAMLEPVGHGNTHELSHGDVIGIGNHALKVVVTDKNSSHKDFPSHEDQLLAAVSPNTSSSVDSNYSLVDNNPPKATVHQLHTTPLENDFNDLSPQIKKNISDLGDSNDNFVAPKFTIPQDWDLELNGINSDPALSPPKVNTPRFNEQENNLIERLLQGLGADKLVASNQITPEMMTVIGRTLRIAINGTLNNRQKLQETKSALSLDEITVARQMESDALSEIPSIDVFIKTLVDPHNKLHTQLPQLLANSYIQSAEDQKDIYEGIDFVKEQLEEGLSPTAIEAAYQQHLQLEAQSAPPLNKLGEKFSQNAKKWNFYRHHWKKICDGVTKNIHKHFESKILLAHAKRIRDKNNANK